MRSSRYLPLWGVSRPSNVGPPRYDAGVDAPAVSPSPFPVAPEDVPRRAVLYVQRTMARHGQPVDTEVAEVIVAGLIGLLAAAQPAAAPGATA